MGRALFLSGALGWTLFLAFSSCWWLPASLFSWDIFKVNKVDLSCLFSVVSFPSNSSLLPHSSTFKDLCDDNGLVWVIQEKPPYFQVSRWAPLVPTETILLLCHVTQHIHKFWELGCGRLWVGFCWPHTLRSLWRWGGWAGEAEAEGRPSQAPQSGFSRDRFHFKPCGAHISSICQPQCSRICIHSITLFQTHTHTH